MDQLQPGKVAEYVGLLPSENCTGIPGIITDGDQAVRPCLAACSYRVGQTRAQAWLSPVLRQYLIIITANLSCITIGLNVAWSSPMLVKLKNGTETVLSRPITEEEGSWIVSIGAVSGMFFNWTIGLLMDGTGRKTCILLGYLPRLTTCCLLVFGKELWVIYLARAFDGIANAFFIVVVPTYASEIAGKECRGALGAISQVASALGTLIIFSIGPVIPYVKLNVVYTCIVAASCIPIWFIPETPYYLYSKGRQEESHSVLTYLRGSETVATEEIKQYYLSQPKISKREIFEQRGKELIGYNAVMFYMQTVLQSTHTSVRDEVASVINGCIQILACFCTILMTDRFGRKPILITTLIGMAAGMIGLGTFFKMQLLGYPISGFLNFLPLLSMMLVIFCFNAGMGALFYTVVAELFDGPARATGVSASIGMATLFVFLTAKYFAFVTNAIGADNTYWMFSVNCVVTALFFFFLIPETKGKTFIEIQEELGRKNFDLRN